MKLLNVKVPGSQALGNDVQVINIKFYHTKDNKKNNMIQRLKIVKVIVDIF